MSTDTINISNRLLYHWQGAVLNPLNALWGVFFFDGNMERGSAGKKNAAHLNQV
ncbi:hypothetical protein [uncultured Desulfuromonas sp.]|uniref:hypothetical protein n=1 Tax=uncultured Desulfuromonas sp. TaxID=181013 RepID=UPI002AAC0534|nr:hypothetical protein [uncultured Desulfuromonas sp.]